MFDTLGFALPQTGTEESEIIEAMVRRRTELRSKGNFEAADKIREELAARKVRLVDRKDGTIWLKVETIE
jgi:cysteinyl-tRNA synthetase